MEHSPIIIALALLAASAACDALWRVIPDTLCIALAVSGVATGLSAGLGSGLGSGVGALGLAGTAWSVIAAAAVFLGGAALFAVGALGGGDVKLAAAVTLWTPLGEVADFLIFTSLLGGALALAYGAAQFGLALARGAGGGAALGVARRAEAPYGVAIAGAGALVLGGGLA